MSNAIPPEKSAAVTRGLSEAFGVTEFEDISGMSSVLRSDLVFRIVVKGSANYYGSSLASTSRPTQRHASTKDVRTLLPVAR
jgi:hypothetical protein